MISKNKLKYLCSLKKKKYRLQEKVLLVEGFRLINEAINAKASIESIYYSDKILNNTSINILFDKCKNKKIELIQILQKDIDVLSDSVSNQGILAVINTPINDKDTLLNHNQLILDTISDPGNMGNILRTADWFGLKSVYLSKKSIEPYNAKTLRSSMGAHFYIDINIIDIVEHIKMLKNNGFTIIGADIKGENLYRWKSPDKWGLVVGNEAHGISQEIRKLIDCNITIPKNGNIESLNVAMATGILLSHIRSNIKD